MSLLADLPLMRPHTLYLLPGGTLTFGSTRPAHRASKGQRAWGHPLLTVAVSLFAQFFLKLLFPGIARKAACTVLRALLPFLPWVAGPHGGGWQAVSHPGQTPPTPQPISTE